MREARDKAKMENTRSIAKLKQYLTDPLRRNALFLMAANASSAFFGFFFWLIAARFYSTEDVGLATALISAMMLLAIISRLGFDIGLIRLLPAEENKRDIINSCLTLVGLFSIVAAIAFIMGLDLWSPKLLFIRENWIYIVAFILFTVTITLAQLQGQVFVAFRSAQFTFIQSVVSGLRLLLVVLLAGLSAFGIFSSVGLAWGLVFIIGNLLILRLYNKYRPIPTIKRQIVNDMARFSFGNYAANILGALPTYILPLIIIAVLTTESSAYFYIPFALIGILGMATEGATFSLLAEGSHEPTRLRSQTIKAAKFISLFLVPGIVILFVFGDPILSIFGVAYAQNSLALLRLFAISCIPWTIIYLYTTVIRVQMRVKPLIYLYAFFAVFIIVVSYWLMKWLGLIGVGIAWLSAQSILAMVTGVLMLKMAGISLKSIPEVLLKRVK